jgi:hypothetical protein
MADPIDPRVTHSDACWCSHYDLIDYYRDVSRRLDNRATDPMHAALADLAVTTAIGMWLTCWRQIHVHRAVMAGASLEQVCAAVGEDPETVRALWQRWADGQRHRWVRGRPGVSGDEYAAVAAAFGFAPLAAETGERP